MKRNKLLLYSLIGMMAFTGPAMSAEAAWQSDERGVWYTTDDGGYLTGQQSIEGKQYYFDDSGWMKTGWQQVNGLWYYYNDDGTMATGFINPDGNTYFLDPNTGVMAVGWTNINDQWYYFKANGCMLTDWQKIGADWYYLDPATGVMLTNQWIGDCYVYADGKMAANTVIDGTAVDANGHKIVNKGWIKTGGKWYYYDDNGNMSTGFISVGGKTYYLDPDSGVMASGWTTVGDSWYYFNGSGAMQTGWKKLGGRWYYLNPDSGVMAVGFTSVNGKTYYLNPDNGAMATGWKVIGDKWYRFTGSGAMITGWTKNGSKWYYMDPATGIMLTSQWVDNDKYYVDEDGKMAVNTIVDGIPLDKNGKKIVKNGWVKADGVWYYYNDNQMAMGWTTAGGKTYYLDPETGAMYTGWKVIDGKWYRFTGSGAMITGWSKSGSKWYYMDPSTGIMATGFAQIGGKTYYLNPDGGAMYTGWKVIDGKWYRFTGSGAMITGWTKSGSKWYYMDPATGVMLTSQWVDNNQYYVDEDGIMAVNTVVDGIPLDGNGKKIVKNGWVKADGVWYYYNDNQLSKGWISVGKSKYYLDPQTGVMYTGWQVIDNKWYRFTGSGSLITGWTKSTGKWYYMDPGTGAMLTDSWVGNYYVGPDGVMPTNTWVNGEYYVGADGKYTGEKHLKGWNQSGGKWYYYNDKFELLKDCWILNEGKWYYLTSDGSRAENTRINEYYVNSDGVRVQDELVKIGSFTYLFGSSGLPIKNQLADFKGNTYYFNTLGQMQLEFQYVNGNVYYFDPEQGGAMLKSTKRVFGSTSYSFDEEGRATAEEVINASVGQAIVDYALQFEGGTYIYGGTDLNVGVDCSGFTLRILEHFGFQLPRTAEEQAWSGGGKFVSENELMPGDLIFYYNPIGHVGIYMGNGQIIHASNEERGITRDPYNYSPITAIVRYW